MNEQKKMRLFNFLQRNGIRINFKMLFGDKNSFFSQKLFYYLWFFKAAIVTLYKLHVCEYTLIFKGNKIMLTSQTIYILRWNSKSIHFQIHILECHHII